MPTSRIVLCPEEMRLIEDLRKVLGVESRIEVIRRSLILLKEALDQANFTRLRKSMRKRMSMNQIHDAIDDGRP